MHEVGVIAMVICGACAFHKGNAGPVEGGGQDGSNADAPTAAVDSFQPPPCPSTYSPQGYRLIATAQIWQSAETACEQDAAGSTHLVVLNNDAERLIVAQFVQSLPGDAWIGIVRDPGDPPWSWRYVTGGAATYALWELTEPNNMSGNQYVAVIRQSSNMLYDYGIDQLLAAVCECDRQPAVNADYDPAT